MKYGFLLIAVLLSPWQNLTSPDRVPFNWPVGVNAVVETDYVNEASLDGVLQDQTQLRMTHDMHVLADPDGRVLQYSNHRPVHSSGDVSRALSALLPLWIPRTVINDKGEFVRIEQADRTRELLLDIYAPLAKNDAVLASPAYKEFVQAMTAADALPRLGASEWRATVGKWVGISIDPEPLEGLGSVALGPGVSAPAAIHQSMSAHGPCTRAETATECATFEIRQTLTPEGLDALKNYFSRGVPGGVQGVVAMVETVERARLEIATMLPHEISITRTMRRTDTVNGRTLTLETAERRTMRYTYSSAR